MGPALRRAAARRRRRRGGPAGWTPAAAAKTPPTGAPPLGPTAPQAAACRASSAAGVPERGTWPLERSRPWRTQASMIPWGWQTATQHVVLLDVLDVAATFGAGAQRGEGTVGVEHGGEPWLVPACRHAADDAVEHVALGTRRRDLQRSRGHAVRRQLQRVNSGPETPIEVIAHRLGQPFQPRVLVDIEAICRFDDRNRIPLLFSPSLLHCCSGTGAHGARRLVQERGCLAASGTGGDTVMAACESDLP